MRMPGLVRRWMLESWHDQLANSKIMAREGSRQLGGEEGAARHGLPNFKPV